MNLLKTEKTSKNERRSPWEFESRTHSSTKIDNAERNQHRATAHNNNMVDAFKGSEKCNNACDDQKWSQMA